MAAPANPPDSLGLHAQVCALLGAPLPELVSQLVARTPGAVPGAAAAGGASSGAASGGGRSAASGAAESGGAAGPAPARPAAASDGAGVTQARGSVADASEAEGPLQRLLLECMSVGLVSDGASVDGLLRCVGKGGGVGAQALSPAARIRLCAWRDLTVRMRPHTLQEHARGAPAAVAPPRRRRACCALRPQGAPPRGTAARGAGRRQQVGRGAAGARCVLKRAAAGGRWGTTGGGLAANPACADPAARPAPCGPLPAA
jgi:hypothetical protein